MLDALCCPDDGAAPLLCGPYGLRCPECGRAFPLQDGIVSLLPQSPGWGAAAEAVLEERGQRDREASVYDRLLALRLFSLLEIPATLGALGIRTGDRVLEAGCGTGRMTVPVARSGAQVIAVDHSRESLRVLRRKLHALPENRVLLLQADAARLPVRSGWASRALTCQMLEHLPSPELRERAVSELARVLEPGGRLALSAYWHPPALRRLLPREGRHSGRIFFHRFHRKELTRLLRPHFEIERLSGRLVYILLAHCLKRRSGVRVFRKDQSLNA